MPTFTPTSTGRLGSKQDWTVPSTGNYRIVAKGARGGYAWLLSTSTINPGGNGARIEGTFTLTAGHVIRMMVGQIGGDNPNAQRGGGGGGCTVVFNQTTSTVLMIAGGGGGAGQYANGTLKHASTSANGNAGMNGGNTASLGNGGTAPSGGGTGSYGGGGAGYSGDGTSNASGLGNGGQAYVGTGNGGLGYNDGSATTTFDGGYGGGGGAYAGGGGGGGYGGGGAGGWSYSGDGGGGGSYNTGTSQVAVVDNSGAGIAIITSLNPPNAPTSLTPTNQQVAAGTSATLGWTHNDPDSDPQAQYQIRWRKADT